MCKQGEKDKISLHPMCTKKCGHTVQINAYEHRYCLYDVHTMYDVLVCR